MLRRFFEFGERDRLEAFKEIRDYLSQDAGVETEVDRAIERRRGALHVKP